MYLFKVQESLGHSERRVRGQVGGGESGGGCLWEGETEEMEGGRRKNQEAERISGYMLFQNRQLYWRAGH